MVLVDAPYGDAGLALSSGTTKCINMSDEVALQFKNILQAANNEASRRSAIRRAEAASNHTSSTATQPSASK